MKNVLIHSLALMLTLVAAGAPWAQDGNSDEKPQATTPGEPQTPTEQAPQKQPPAAEDEVFKPTEEISEDLSVSFPVDI